MAPFQHYYDVLPVINDVINVIFGKTAITPSVYELKTSSKNKTDP